MAKVDLSIKSKQIFGKYLPSVYINRILIYKSQDEETGMSLEGGDYEFDCYLTINFTKGETIAGERYLGPDGVVWEDGVATDKALGDYIENNLDELYLYGWFSGFEELNDALKKDNLNLQDVFFAFDSPHGDELTSDHPSFPYIMAVMFNLYAYGLDLDGGATWESVRPDILDDYSSEEIYAIITSNYVDLDSYEKRNVFLDFWGKKADADIMPDITGPWDGPDHTHCFMLRFLDYTMSLLTDSGTAMTEVPAGPEGAASDRHIVYYKIPLTDLVGTIETPSTWKSFVTTSGTRDLDGNEIFQIQNILLKFKVKYQVDDSTDFGPGYLPYQTRLDMMKKVFTFFTIGVDNEILTTTNHTFYNKNFGDITWEHVLKYNEVPNKEETIFVEAVSEAPYYDVPIQTFDGRYFKPEPVSHQDVVDSINSLIAEHEPNAASDSVLKTNIDNLKSVLETKYNSKDLLPTLQLYRHTFRPKSTGTKSGTFYNDFSPLLNVLNGTVGIQIRLRKKRIYNTRVTDLRGSDYENIYAPAWPNYPYKFNDEDSADELSGYVGPLYTGDPDGSGRPSTPGGTLNPQYYLGNEYIPRAWVKLARSSVLVYPSQGGQSDFYEFLAEGNPSFGLIWEDIRKATLLSYGAEVGTEPDDPGMITWDQILEIYRRGNTTGTPEQIRAPNDLYADYVVKNRGTFFFDWEKALHTQSNLSHVFDLSRLQRIMHLTVPYKYFKVKDIRLIRKEFHLSHVGADYADPFIDPETHDPHDKDEIMIMTLTMDTSEDYPVGLTTYHYSTEDEDEGGKSYGYPYVYTFDNYSNEWYSDALLGYGLTQDIIGSSGMPVHGGIPSSHFAEMLSYEGMDLEGGTHDYFTSTGKEKWESWFTTGGDDTLDVGPAPGPLGAGWQNTYKRFNITAIESEMRALQAKDTSYVKFVNFDVFNKPEAMLRQYNPYVVGGGEDITTTTLNLDNGKKVKEGYRIMAFEFQDFMDDDVAYYNTYAHEYEDAPGADYTLDTSWDAVDDWKSHSEALIARSKTGESTSEYYIKIRVEDRSLEFFVSEMLTDLKKVYDAFVLEYYSLAQEVCSYNNVAEEYNKFFTDAIWEIESGVAEEGGISESGFACLLAVVYYNAWRELLYKSFSKKATEEASSVPEARAIELMMEESRIMGNKIMPPNGTLGQLEEFKINFSTLINLCVPQGDYEESTIPGIEDWGGSYDLRSAGYTHHPVYDRMLQLCGWDAEDDGIEWTTTSMHTGVGEDDRYDSGVMSMLQNIMENVTDLTFWNSIPIIDEERMCGRGTIAGDLQLADELHFDIYSETEPPQPDVEPQPGQPGTESATPEGPPPPPSDGNDDTPAKASEATQPVETIDTEGVIYKEPTDQFASLASQIKFAAQAGILDHAGWAALLQHLGTETDKWWSSGKVVSTETVSTWIFSYLDQKGSKITTGPAIAKIVSISSAYSAYADAWYTYATGGGTPTSTFGARMKSQYPLYI